MPCSWLRTLRPTGAAGCQDQVACQQLQAQQAAGLQAVVRNQQPRPARDYRCQAGGPVDGFDTSLNHGADPFAAEQRGQFRLETHAWQIALGKHPPAFQHDDVRGEPHHVFELVGDQHHRQCQFVAQPFEVGQQLTALGRVDRSQRLIEQQQPRLGQQRAPERDPLPLAARQLPAAPAQQWAQVQQFEHALHRYLRWRGTGAPQAVAQVSRDVEVWKQPQLLEYAGEPPQVRGHIDRARRIVEGETVDLDQARIRAQQASEQVQERRLAGAGAAKQGRDAGRRRRETGFEAECSALHPQFDPQHAQRPSLRRMPRASTSAAMSPARPSTKLMSAMRAAAASPSTLCSAE